MSVSLGRPVQWLGATAIHSKDDSLAHLMHSLVALCDSYPQLQMIVNLFDREPVDANTRIATLAGNHSRVEGTWIPGMKTLFWKQVPQRRGCAAMHLPPPRLSSALTYNPRARRIRSSRPSERAGCARCGSSTVTLRCTRRYSRSARSSA